MKLHTDAWWAPAPTRRERKPLPVGSITRERFDEFAAGPPALIAPPACCNIMWMLDDFTEEKDATRVVPGSHLLGRQPHPERDKGVTTASAVAPAGTAMVFEGRLWHGTGANRGNGPRMGLLTTFCGPQYRPQENFTVGTRPEVLADASPDLRALLGFKVWWGYGRIENPAVDFIEPGETSLGEMYPA
jgi:ectoine hydroxylase-related dioxygenase (phytanoyl-CoA dioxygenase family)